VADRDPLLRIFRDYFGREWEVRAFENEQVEAQTDVAKNPALARGSLVFDSGEQRRCLAPLPPGWYVASDELLSRWCANAVPLPARSRRRAERFAELVAKLMESNRLLAPTMPEKYLRAMVEREAEHQLLYEEYGHEG
jgi:hypothetical protein